MTISLILPASILLTREQFFELCQINETLCIERSPAGALEIALLSGGEAGNREAQVIGQLGVWAEADATGLGFSSSTGFELSTGAVRSPDACWISMDRWNQVPADLQKRFAPICPDFVVELRSASDNLAPLQRKMEEYLAEPGCRLGFLIDRKNRRVYVYRPNQSVEQWENPNEVIAEPELPGFVLQLGKVW